MLLVDLPVRLSSEQLNRAKVLPLPFSQLNVDESCSALDGTTRPTRVIPSNTSLRQAQENKQMDGISFQFGATLGPGQVVKIEEHIPPTNLVLFGPGSSFDSMYSADDHSVSSNTTDDHSVSGSFDRVPLEINSSITSSHASTRQSTGLSFVPPPWAASEVKFEKPAKPRNVIGSLALRRRIQSVVSKRARAGASARYE